jgi:hypothetical protein
VAQVEAVADLEQGALVLPEVLLDQGTAFLEDAPKVEDRRSLALGRRVTSSEERDGVANAGGGVGRAVVELDL